MMNAPFFYSIGGLTVRVDDGAGLGDLERLAPFAPFRLHESPETCDLRWRLDSDVAAPTGDVAFDMSVGMGRCRVYVQTDSVVCELAEEKSDGDSARLYYDICANEVYISPMPVSWMHFALWIAYNMQASACGRYAFHAAAVVCDGMSALFLGESGTGKSTHARQWMAAFDGCTLLNDDSPVVAFDGSAVWVYGSPWSGKTPCYLPERYPLKGLARLRQSPCNMSRRLNFLEAIAALVPSFPPMLVHVEPFRTRMLSLIEALVKHVPVVGLDCLPNPEAAICCRKEMEN